MNITGSGRIEAGAHPRAFLIAAAAAAWLMTALSPSAGLATTANDICPGLPPVCTVSTTVTITPNSVLDFGTSALQILGGTLQAEPGSRGIFTIKAGSLTIDGSGKILATGSNTIIGGRIIIETTGDITVAGRIDVSNDLLGGEITIRAGGAFTTAGKIRAKGSTIDGSGGFILVEAEGDLSAGGEWLATGGSQSEGGFIALASGSGDVIMTGTFDLNGGGGGGEISVEATSGNIFLNPGVPVTIRGTGGCSEDGACGDAGFADLLAMNDLSFFGKIDATPTGVDTSGGEVTMFAGRDVLINSSQAVAIDCSGGSFDGGELDIEAGRDLRFQSGELRVFGESGGSGGAVSLTAGGTLDVLDEIFADGRGIASSGWQIFGGEVMLFSQANVNVTSSIEAAGKDGGGGSIEIVAANDLTIASPTTASLALDTRSLSGGGAGGDIRLTGGQNVTLGNKVILESEGSASPPKAGAAGPIIVDGCTVTTDPTVNVLSRGEAPGSLIKVTVHDGGTLAGIFDANGTVPGTIDIFYRSAAPGTSGATFTPPATFTHNPALAACPECGDGIIQLGEDCDNGNTAGGDCCDATCHAEPNGNPCDDGSECTTESCLNGFCIPKLIPKCSNLGDIDCSGGPNQPDPADALAQLCLFVKLCGDSDFPAPCNTDHYRLSVGDWDMNGQIDPNDALTSLGIFVNLIPKSSTALGACCP